MCSNIRCHDTEDKFEADLQAHSGKKGCSSFMKFIQGHPWRNCNVALYKEPTRIQGPRDNKGLEDEESDPLIVTAVITPSREEKRIHGLVTFENGVMTEVYSIFPIHINQAGEACVQLKVSNFKNISIHHNYTLFKYLTL